MWTHIVYIYICVSEYIFISYTACTVHTVYTPYCICAYICAATLKQKKNKNKDKKPNGEISNKWRKKARKLSKTIKKWDSLARYLKIVYSLENYTVLFL